MAMASGTKKVPKQQQTSSTRDAPAKEDDANKVMSATMKSFHVMPQFAAFASYLLLGCSKMEILLGSQFGNLKNN